MYKIKRNRRQLVLRLSQPTRNLARITPPSPKQGSLTTQLHEAANFHSSNLFSSLPFSLLPPLSDIPFPFHLPFPPIFLFLPFLFPPFLFLPFSQIQLGGMGSAVSRKLNLMHFKWKIWHLATIILVMSMENYLLISPCLWQNTHPKIFWGICSNVYTVSTPPSPKCNNLVSEKSPTV